MTTTPGIGITHLVEGVVRQEPPVNDAFNLLDLFARQRVLSAVTAAEPGSPVNGDAYILPTTALTGTNWSTFTNRNIAFYYDGWMEITRQEGMSFWVNDENARRTYNGSAWESEEVLIIEKTLTATSGELAAGNDFTLFHAPAEFEFVDATAVIVGTGTDVDWNLRTNSNRSSGTSDVYSSDQTTTSKTTGSAHNSFNVADVNSSDWLWLRIIDVDDTGGSVDEFHLTITMRRVVEV